MRKTKSATVPTLSRPPLAPLNFADNYSLGGTNKKPFQTNTILIAIATASQYKTLYRPHTSPKEAPCKFT